jgi:hypothetical protein
MEQFFPTCRFEYFPTLPMILSESIAVFFVLKVSSSTSRTVILSHRDNGTLSDAKLWYPSLRLPITANDRFILALAKIVLTGKTNFTILGS